MRKSKNRYFHHIFVFPGDAPGEITLNVVWMERELDAYKLSRWMFPFNYNFFWHTTTIIFICHNNIKMRTECKMLAGEIFVEKSSIYQAPLAFDAPVRGFPWEYRHPLWDGKTIEWCRYPMVEKFRRYVYSFWRDPRTWQTDGRTAKTALMHRIAR